VKLELGHIEYDYQKEDSYQDWFVFR